MTDLFVGTYKSREALFDLRFFEHHVFARNGVVFSEFHFLSQIPWIFLGHVVVTGTRCALELD